MVVMIISVRRFRVWNAGLIRNGLKIVCMDRQVRWLGLSNAGHLGYMSITTTYSIQLISQPKKTIDKKPDVKKNDLDCRVHFK